MNAVAMYEPNERLSREITERKRDRSGFRFTDREVVAEAERLVNGFVSSAAPAAIGVIHN